MIFRSESPLRTSVQKILLTLLFFFSLYSEGNYAYTTKQWGDIGNKAIPITSAVVALLLKDTQGLVQLGMGVLLVQGSTEALKAITREHRPNGACCGSFPSGHTSSAFTGASFMNFRYGIKYAFPFYAGATFVAASRVQANAHYVHDVIAGAALGILGTYLTTMPYNDGTIAITFDTQGAGIIYRKIFD